MELAPARRERERRAKVRSWWADSLEGLVWLAAAGAVALLIANGGLLGSELRDRFYSLGRILGVIAAVLMMVQMLLASRAPWVERALGHDRAVMKHTRLGKIAISLMLTHVALITAITASYDGRSVWSQPIAFTKYGWHMLFALIAISAFIIVLSTSILAVRRRWRYEQWHSVHLLVYVGIVFAVPHQFLEGSTFRAGGTAWWYWFTLYVVSVGSLLVFRVLRPLARFWWHRLAVASVEPLADGTTQVTITGRRVERLRAAGGQFFLWRFLAKGLWNQAHPYSLSAAPTAAGLRITVRPSGDGSSALAHVRVGTKVMAEGPLGVFTHSARTRDSLVLVAAGIGVTPIRSMLEEAAGHSGDVTVILRASAGEDAPLRAEVEALAASIGATVHVLVGKRGEGWLPAKSRESLKELAPHLDTADVFICGPVAWAKQVAADARASGVPEYAIHREEFAW